MNSSRRGSRLLDFLEKKKRNERKKIRDKQGFVWRRMVHDDTAEDLPSSRAPHLGHGATPWIPSEGTPSIASTTPLPISTDQMLRKISMISNRSEPVGVPHGGAGPEGGESTSMTSFKTCPSDSNLQNLVPKQVADNYKPPIPLPVAVQQNTTPLKSTLATPTPPPSHQRTPSSSATPPTIVTNPQNATSNENVIGGVRHLVRER